MNDKRYLYNALCNGLVWTAACGLIGYAIKKTGKISPLLALLLVPTFSLKIAKGKEEENNDENTEDPESNNSAADAEVQE